MDPLIQVRTSLTTTSHTTGGDTRSGIGGNEIQKVIDRMIVDQLNRAVDLRPLIKRKPWNQLSFLWNLRTDFGSTGKSAFYSDGASGTPYPSTKVQLFTPAVALRADYEVTGLMEAASSSYYDAIQDEARDALTEMSLVEEKSMICGTDTGAYGFSGAYQGLLQLMRWHTSNGGDTEGTANNRMLDATSIYGITRTSGTTYLDVSYVIAGTIAASTGTLALKHLDEAITRSNNHGGKGANRIFFCSEDRVNEISRLLQPQQRFVAGAGQLELEGGFRVLIYRGNAIIGSRFMDKNGSTNTGSWDSSTDTDNSMYLLNLDELEFKVVGGVDARHVPIQGRGDSGNQESRADVRGGYFKTYGMFLTKAFTRHVHIANLTAPTVT